jgi:hypothetical protein
MIDNIQTSINHDQIIPRPPPLFALSQAIRRKYPEELIETKSNNPLPSIKDLPNAPANYSFVFLWIFINVSLSNKNKNTYFDLIFQTIRRSKTIDTSYG